MANASSTFLRGANAVNGGDGFTAPDEGSVLGAINTSAVVNVPTLAASLATSEQMVAPVLRQLVDSGLVDDSTNGLTLSESGQRALRYSSIAQQ